MVSTVTKVIKPKKLRQKELRLTLLNEMRKVGRRMRNDFKKTVATWEGEKPDFEFLISLSGNESPSMLVGPVGSERAVQKWVWLDEGTSVRYATMTPDFIAKTRVKVIDSFTGQGGLAFVNTNRPRPGIEARQWTQEMEKRWDKRFKRAMEDGMRKAAKASGHSI